MYMSKEVYVKNWDMDKVKKQIIVRKNADVTEHLNGSVTIEGGTKIAGIDESKISTIIQDVAYWRKANAIHNWFVQNVQNGVDECQKSYVSEDKLKELYKLVQNVLKIKGNKDEKAMVEELLPPTSGFFFGSTEIDEYFWEDLESTIEQLKPEIEDIENGISNNYYYRSSW